MRIESEKKKQDRQRSLRGRAEKLHQEEQAKARRIAIECLHDDDFDIIIEEHMEKMNAECPPVATVPSDACIQVPQSKDSNLAALTNKLVDEHNVFEEKQKERECILLDVDGLLHAARSVGGSNDACQFIDASQFGDISKPTRLVAQRKAGRRCPSRRRSKRTMSLSGDVARDSARRALHQRRIEKSRYHSGKIEDRMFDALQSYKDGSLTKSDALALGGLNGWSRRMLKSYLEMADEQRLCAIDVERRRIIDDACALKRSAYDWMHPEVECDDASARLYSLPGICQRMFVLYLSSILLLYILLYFISYHSSIESDGQDQQLYGGGYVEGGCVGGVNVQNYETRLNKALHSGRCTTTEFDFDQGGSNACAAISMYISILYAFSNHSFFMESDFRHGCTKIGRDIATQARVEHNWEENSFICLDSAKNFFDSFLDEDNHFAVNGGDIYTQSKNLLVYIDSPRKAAICEYFSILVQIEHVYFIVNGVPYLAVLKIPCLLAALLCNGHVVTLINTNDGRFELYDSLPAPNASCLQTQHAFKVTCSNIDDMHVALMHLLSSRSGGTDIMERYFNALVISGTSASDIGSLDEQLNAMLGDNGHDTANSESEDDMPPPKVCKHQEYSYFNNCLLSHNITLRLCFHSSMLHTTEVIEDDGI